MSEGSRSTRPSVRERSCRRTATPPSSASSATPPATFTAAQMRIFLRALVNLDPYTFAQDVAEHFAGRMKTMTEPPRRSCSTSSTAWATTNSPGLRSGLPLPGKPASRARVRSTSLPKPTPPSLHKLNQKQPQPERRRSPQRSNPPAKKQTAKNKKKAA